jgi:hypothetical protein
MRLDELAQALREFEERLVGLGVSRGAAKKAIADAECVALDDLVETAADRRLLDLFDEIGSTGLSARKGNSPRTWCRKRQEAAERLYQKQIGQSVSPPVSAEAA